MPEHNPVVSITLSCPEPADLAEFYRQATGWATIYESADAIYLGGESGVRLGIDRGADYTRPTWSRESLATVRLDLAAADLPSAEQRLLSFGASRPGHAFDTDQWIFMADPAGHMFSLTTVY